MKAEIERLFPNLLTTGYQITSSATPDYNCIAWAAEDTTVWWWPDAFGFYYWPPDIPRTETLAAFIAAYSLLGYLPCLDAQPEPGYEKIAIYLDATGAPTHATRLLTSGIWTSKLGQLEDISHQTLDGLEGRLYGRAVQVLRRPLSE